MNAIKCKRYFQSLKVDCDKIQYGVTKNRRDAVYAGRIPFVAPVYKHDSPIARADGIQNNLLVTLRAAR